MSEAAADCVPGDASGLMIPAHPDALEAAGAEFLTRAFRAYGSLGEDNAVARITRCEPFHAGNSGQKLVLSVDYARPDPALHTELFVKFSRELTDAFRDRRRYELEAEVRLAALSRLPAFPVRVARPYFADFHHASGSGVLITERISFGEGGIEPLCVKNKDHELANPLDHYRATVTALARLAAADHAGRLSPDLERLFPFDAVSAAADLPIPWDAAQLRAKAAAIGEFVAAAPQLFPPGVRAADFAARLERDALAFLRHETQVRCFLYGDPRLVALSHWNTHIDNAWFWRDEAGVLRCGLLDWGMVRRMNVAIGLWGGLSGATPEFLARHLDELLCLFAQVLRAEGGPEVGGAELGLHFDLAVAMIGLALLMDAPALLCSRMPEVTAAAGPNDPLLERDKVVLGFLHTFAAFLSAWERRDFGASLGRMAART